MMYENNKYFKQARKELEYLSGDKDFQEIVEKRALALMDQEVQTRLAKEEGREEGKTEGISIGIAQNTVETIKKLIQENMTNEVIKRVTGYKEEEIEKIRKEIKEEQNEEESGK